MLRSATSAFATATPAAWRTGVSALGSTDESNELTNELSEPLAVKVGVLVPTDRGFVPFWAVVAVGGTTLPLRLAA
jgi:hypothetical protein